MNVPDELKVILDRIANHQQTEADIAILRQWLSSDGQIVTQTGKYAVNLGEGQDIHVGDRVYQGVDAKAIREIIRSIRLELQSPAQPAISQGILHPLAEKDQLSVDELDELVQNARSHCSEKIQSLYSKIRLLNRKQLEVDRLYVDVYILEQLTGKTYASIPSLLEYFDPKNDRLALGRKKKRSLGFEAADKYDKLMVLGKPGAGKSTFLRHLAIACCKAQFQPTRIPVLVELRTISDGDTFDLTKLIQKELRLTDESQTKQILDDGKVLLLLDGLDEVVERVRSKVHEQIECFLMDYYKNRVIVTCRTQVAENNLNQFEYIEVADFNQKQVEQFAHNWFMALAETPKQGRTLAKRFIRKLKQLENRQTAELAVTPVLLSLACWVFQDMQDFPQDPTELYRRGVELLLEQWDESRGVRREFSNLIYRKLSVEDKQMLLGYMAISKFKKDEFALFKQDEIQKYIAEYLKINPEESGEVLKSIEAQHGLLVERASEIYSFSHLTFQEYFAARWLCVPSNFISTASDIVGQRWQEILPMVFKASDADRIAQTIKSEIDHLLVSDPKLQQFLSWLKTKAQSLEGSYKPTAVRAIYFVFALDLALPRATALSHALDLTPRLDRELPLADTSRLERNYALDFARDFVRTLDFILTRTPNFELARNLAGDLDLALVRTEEDLKHKLQALRDQIPNLFTENPNNIKQWWKEWSKAWIAQLREILSEHYNIWSDWQLSDAQKQLLRQYYDANKLLVDCLRKGKVNPNVRQEIEETLLLPIAEIEKHKRERGG